MRRTLATIDERTLRRVSEVMPPPGVFRCADDHAQPRDESRPRASVERENWPGLTVWLQDERRPARSVCE